MTLSEYLAKLRRRLGDTQVDGHFSTTLLQEFACEAQRDIASRVRPFLLPELHVVATGSIESGSYFEVTGNVAQVESLMVFYTTNQDVEVTVVTDNSPLKTIRYRNEFYKAGNKQYYAYMEQGRFYIEPDQGGHKYKLRYVKAMQDYATSASEMDLSDRWEDLTLDYGQYLAYLEEGNVTKADMAYKKYIEKIQTINGAV